MFNYSPAHGKAEARAGRQMMGMLSGAFGQDMTEREWSEWFYRYQTELVRILKGWMQESEGKLPSFRGIQWDGVLEVLRENGGEGPALAREFERLHDRYEKAGDRDNMVGMEDALVDRMHDALDSVHSMYRSGGYYRVSENPDYDDSVMFDGVRGSAFGNLSGSADEHRAKFQRFYQTLMQELRSGGSSRKLKARSIGHMGVLLGRLRAHFEELPKDVQQAELPNRDMAVTAYRAFIQRQER